MSNLLFSVKGLGFAIVGVIAFSGTSAIAQISQDGALPHKSCIARQENSSGGQFENKEPENPRRTGNNNLKFNYIINQTKVKFSDTVENQQPKEFLPAEGLKCCEDEYGNCISCW
ncbi:MAG: hypothetical protein KME55_12085 [Nostoc indistinguendum CM1-VF10]|jgi:hypothetical protein|nr:hypothetical protein [Nostoc indistinguendum CM1-VF10]